MVSTPAFTVTRLTSARSERLPRLVNQFVDRAIGRACQQSDWLTMPEELLARLLYEEYGKWFVAQERIDDPLR